MKFSVVALCMVVALAGEHAQAARWQPSPGHTQISIWPGTPPDDMPMPGPESSGIVQKNVGGRPWTYATNISVPTMTVYSPRRRNTGAAVLVLPGGGFEVLAIDLEGTEVCDWLTSRGITCVLLKYRVPSEPYDQKCDCRPDNLATSTRSLEDAQRTIGLMRLQARKLHIDPHEIGVLGFSAGGYLAAEISTRYKKRLYAPIDEADKQSARPDFAVLVYPGHLATGDKPGRLATGENGLNPNVPVTSDTPPTFLVQAENDNTDGVIQSLVYSAALRKAGAKVELHLYAEGGHAFGLRHTALPITDWPRLVEIWLHSIGMIQEK
ncbi:alpha/beta hydrolase [Hyphomicrobium sp.]|jgi:acetyl esterase/lipase|uniref:alpha/beta hydrolase n=1 Tax=Hyphomicrobium sp. TaxID=82 RepID=UPI002B799B8B|nr:alpha/beta hydrolase [Hyphomicrobium sp.]HVZ05480.1 alpha/beta hydrolase [Hyphomicrobium sp.]